MKNKILDKHLANQKRIEKALTAHIKQRNAMLADGQPETIPNYEAVLVLVRKLLK